MSTPTTSPRRFRILRFRLASLLIVVTVGSWGLSSLMNEYQRAARRQTLVDELLDQQASVITDETPPSVFSARAWFYTFGNERRYLPVASVTCKPSTRRESIRRLSHLAELKELSLRDTQMDNELLTSLSPLRELTDLDLSGTQISDRGLKRLADLHKLQHLAVDNTSVSGVEFGSLVHLPSLASLSLAGTRVNDDTLDYVAKLSRLETLTLDDTAVSDAGLVRLAAMPRLKRISVAGTAVTDRGLIQLSQSLPELLVSGSTKHVQQPTGMLKPLEAFGPLPFGRLKTVEQIHLGTAMFSDLMLEYLATRADSLWHLTLSETRVTDAGLEHVPALRSLRVLSITNGSDGKITDRCLESVGKCHNLEFLQLTRVPCTPEGIQALIPLSRLEALRILEQPINAAVFSEIAQLRNLRWLHLEGLEITDSNLAQLSHLPLVELSLSHANISVDGLKTLIPLKALKKLTVAHSQRLNVSDVPAIEPLFPDATIQVFE